MLMNITPEDHPDYQTTLLAFNMYIRLRETILGEYTKYCEYSSFKSTVESIIGYPVS